MVSMQTILREPFKVPFPSPFLFASGDGDGGSADKSPQFNPIASRGEDLPYKVEVWDEKLTAVDQTLAMTANGSIGYAAYYEATREYPDRYVVLRHKNRIVARWNPPDT
jgi:hypothetical protein